MRPTAARRALPAVSISRKNTSLDSRARLANSSAIERLGLVAPAEEFAPLAEAPARALGTRKWPSYAHALDSAPLDSEGHGPDRSRADFVWCMTAITWGFGVDETAERLIEESRKARANGKTYAVRTARNAAAAVQRRQTGNGSGASEHGRG